MRDMKKFYLILMGVATLSFATLSCSKEAADPSQQEQTQKEDPQKEDPTSENPTGEDDTPVPEGMVRLTFGVSHEGDAPANEGDDTKTTWDGTTHGWATGDQIRIIVGEGDVEGTDYVDATVVGGKVTAVVPEADYYYAVYPTTATYALDLANGKLTITVPCYQTGSFSDANIMAAKTTKAAANLEFKNMTSIIKFTTGSTYSYNSVSFMANDQTILTGTVSTTFPSNKFAVDTAVGTESIVCIQKGEPSENAGVSADNTYYLAMLPGAKIDDGIGFKIEECGTETKLIAGGLSKSVFYRERDKIYDMGTLDDRIVTDWYISVSGTGVGIVESAPASPARLMDLLNPSYSTNNTTAGWRLTNATIHVAGGTYNLQELNGGEVFDPHYELSDSDLKVHVKGEGDASNPTKFICNQSADNDHIFAVTGSHKVGDFTFENITFTANPSASNTNSSGVAFNYSGTSNVDNVITFKDCVFDGFTSTANSDVYGGAAVFVASAKEFDILFEGCSFTNNKSVRGAVALSNSGKKGNVSFSGCYFSNNTATNNGGAFYVYGGGKTTIDSSKFEGDGENSSALNGGAITVIKNASVTLQNGSIINKCVSTGNGGAIFNHGTVILDNSTISNCLGKLGGAIYTDGNLTIKNNSTISGNSMYGGGTNGGGIYSTYSTNGSGTPTIDIENSSFVSNASTNGAAIYGAAKKDVATPIIVTRVFNTLFKSNAASGGADSGANRNGGCVFASDYHYLLFANCTFSDNTVAKGAIISMGRTDSADYNKLYLVSSTIDGENDGIQRNSKVNVVYNSIVIGNKTNTAQNLSINHSIWGTGGRLNIYGPSTLQTNGNYTNTATSNNIAFALGTYSDGVYPLINTYSSQYTQGMSASDIQKLTFSNIDLSDDQKTLLGKDQMGNDRGDSKIMGAYVLTTAPKE